MEAWNKSYLGFFIAALVFLIWACNKDKELQPRDYVNWVENPTNGLRMEKIIKPLKFEIQYKPLDYIIAMEEREESLPADFVENRKAELGEEMDYFNLRIGLAEGSKNVLMETAADESEYYQMIDYLSYAAQKDIYLLQGADTSKCLLYQFVRNYELAPYLDFALGFERKGEGDKTFVFDDKAFRVGIIKAKLEQQKINKLPKLKTN